ncbi:MAG: VCBS repeat-containing protein [Verrucomicrobiota bacterium]
MSQNEVRSSTLRSAAADNAATLPSDAPGVPANPSRHGYGGRELRLLPPVLLSIFLLACSSAQAKPKFNVSEIAGPYQQLMICDLDGDGLKDLVLMDDTNLSIFYQDTKLGFTREPQQTWRLEPRPCLVWAAKLGGPAGSLLVMTSDGVTELCFTNRTGPPAIRQIIRQPTIVPEAMDAAEGTNAIYLPLSVETGLRRAAVTVEKDLEQATATQAGRDWPLLLVPAADGIQVWQHRGEWRQAQCLSNSIEASLQLSVTNPGYTRSLGFDLSVGDVNGDGRDALMVRRSNGWTNSYSLYLQQSNGLFAVEPALIYADKVEPFSWLCWVDLNRDDKMDLIKGIWLNEASFLPGVPSGKVLVSTYIADEHGKIPAEPQQVFRKNDWTAAVPVVDVDGDGFPDLVLGYSQIEDKEGFRKMITSKKLDYNLRFYFYRPGIGFPTEADCQRDVVIHLDRAEMQEDLPEYFGRYVKLGGDFNGDGKTDLLVRDHSDAISVYSFVSREKGFSPKPDLRFSCLEPIDEWQVADLNNDGVSDLIVKLAKQKGYRIFISQK